MAQSPNSFDLLMLPEIAVEKIFSFLTYDEIAQNRIVCKKFNEIGGKLLTRGFVQLEKRNSSIYKRVKQALPRRESERKNHPCARHCDILQAVETRMSMLNMTYMRYIDNKLICFIPGKVLDEIKKILAIVLNDKIPSRSQQLLQELRDLSSMAIEHFDEHILPRCKEQMEKQTDTTHCRLKQLEAIATSLAPHLTPKYQGAIYKVLATTSKVTQQPISWALPTELRKMKTVTKNHKHHITYLMQNMQKLCMKMRKQNTKLHVQGVKLREQERKIQEQSTKITEQDAALIDLKKHMDEWEQKYKDLTAELVRARDEILLKASSNSPLLGHPACSSSQSPPFTSNIKPRTAQILPKSYVGLEVERKRKSCLSPDIPLKRNRSPSAPGLSTVGQKAATRVQDITLNIPDLESFNKSPDSIAADKEKHDRVHLEGSKDAKPCGITFLDNLLTNPMKAYRIRKRKMPEDIDLK